MNLLALMEQMAEATARPGRLFLAPERCLHKRDKLSDCAACFDICPVAAIVPGQPPSLQQDVCINCRACLPVCPVQAYQAADEIAPLLKQALRLKGKRLELICAPHPQVETGLPTAHAALISRGCLAGLGSGTYLALLALGLSEVILRTDACADCPLGALHEQIEQQVTAVQQRATHWPENGRIHTSGPLPNSQLVRRTARPATTPPLSRRELFGLKPERPTPLPDWLQDDEAGRPATNHRLTTAALINLGPPDPAQPPPDLSGLGLAAVSVNADRCTASGVCARACPTNALHFVEDKQGAFRLSLAPLNCIGCELCAHVCMPDAIKIDHNPTWTQLFEAELSVTLLTGQLTACERCGSGFLAKDEQRYCAICEFRRKNPFAWTLPPGFDEAQAGLTPADTP